MKAEINARITLYKYRGGSEEIFQRDLQALRENYFFAPTYNNLNDPCEGMILSDRIESQSSFLLKLFGGNRQTLTDFLEVKDEFILAKEKIGIYSLSGTYLNELLWAHYSGGHYGFCVGFNLKKLIENNLYQKLRSSVVSYSDKLPNLSILDISNEDKIINKLIGQKSKLWSYEEETRIISDVVGKNYFEYDAVESIYFGLRMSDSHKEQIMNSLKGRKIKYFQITQENNSYKFGIEPFEDFYKDSIPFLGLTYSEDQKLEYTIEKKGISQ